MRTPVLLSVTHRLTKYNSDLALVLSISESFKVTHHACVSNCYKYSAPSRYLIATPHSTGYLH